MAANYVLILQISKDADGGLFRCELYDSFRSTINSKFTTIEQNSIPETIELLSKPSKPGAVLVVDGGVSYGKGKRVQKALAQYARAGGTVVFGCLFSSFVRPNNLDAMFGAAFSLPWKNGDYHRSTFAVNEALEPVFGGELFATLAKSYSMKAVHLMNVGIESRLYVPTPSSRTESHVFPSARVDPMQVPIVFAKYWEGYLGYIGDVNNEEETTNVTVAMLQASMNSMLSSALAGTRLNPEAEEFRPQASPNTSVNAEETTDRCSVCGKTSSVKRCSGCRVKEYCSRECQKLDWKEHKKTCKKANEQTQGTQFPRFDDIFTNRPRKEVFRNLINVYRLRTEDTYTFSGDLVGLYSNPERLPKKHFENFLAKAERSGLLPLWWDETARKDCSELAMDPNGGSHIGHAVEKSDIQEEYGNPMMPMLLRMTADQIYGPGNSPY